MSHFSVVCYANVEGDAGASSDGEQRIVFHNTERAILRVDIRKGCRADSHWDIGNECRGGC